MTGLNLGATTHRSELLQLKLPIEKVTLLIIIDKELIIKKKKRPVRTIIFERAGPTGKGVKKRTEAVIFK